MNKNVYIILFILFFVVLGILAFKKDSSKDIVLNQENKPINVESSKQEAVIPEQNKEGNLPVKQQPKIMQDSDITKLDIKVTKEGEGTLVTQKGNILFMNYTGKLLNGKTFDSNVDPAFGHVEPFSFQLGIGQVIQGWDEGLLNMKKGEKRTLTIPSDMAYGSRGAGGAIPPNAALIFEVELLDFK